MLNHAMRRKVRLSPRNLILRVISNEETPSLVSISHNNSSVSFTDYRVQNVQALGLPLRMVSSYIKSSFDTMNDNLSSIAQQISDEQLISNES